MTLLPLMELSSRTIRICFVIVTLEAIMKMKLFTSLLTIFFLSILARSTSCMADENKTQQNAPDTEIAQFAGGCFWCMQPPFDALKGKGVLSTTVGYTGGHTDNPTYQQVSSG